MRHFKRRASAIEQTAHCELLFDYTGFDLKNIYMHNDLMDQHALIFQSVNFIFKKTKNKVWDLASINALFLEINSALLQLKHLPHKSDADILLQLSIVEVTVRFHLFFLNTNSSLLQGAARQFNEVYAYGTKVLHELSEALYSAKQFKKIHARAINSMQRLQEAYLLNFTEFNCQCKPNIEKFLQAIIEKETHYDYVPINLCGHFFDDPHKKSATAVIRTSAEALGLPPLPCEGMLVPYDERDEVDSDPKLANRFLEEDYDEMQAKRELLHQQSVYYHKALKLRYGSALLWSEPKQTDLPEGIVDLINCYMERRKELNFKSIGQLMAVISDQIIQLDQQLAGVKSNYTVSDIPMPMF